MTSQIDVNYMQVVPGTFTPNPSNDHRSLYPWIEPEYLCNPAPKPKTGVQGECGLELPENFSKIREALREGKVPTGFGEKPSNPKDIIGSDKIPLHLWPETATVLGSLGMLEGALKYGRSNFRAVGVKASIYIDAAKRHLNKWFEGQDIDPDSGLPELGKALACIAILIDAEAVGKLNDDRMVKGGYLKLIEEMTPHVKRLKEQYKNHDPKHYTIEDEV